MSNFQTFDVMPGVVVDKVGSHAPTVRLSISENDIQSSIGEQILMLEINRTDGRSARFWVVVYERYGKISVTLSTRSKTQDFRKSLMARFVDWMKRD